MYQRHHRSLPSRERGLKSPQTATGWAQTCRSLRGSVDWNLLGLSDCFCIAVSLPSRERGLKYVKHGNYPQAQGRSLRGSVDWNMFVIESINGCMVAPFAGAWIEIYASEKYGITYWSLPSRERGLKLWWMMQKTNRLCRSLRGSVDWNLCMLILYYGFPMSLPSRERGLKSVIIPLANPPNMSLPSRERGLK